MVRLFIVFLLLGTSLSFAQTPGVLQDDKNMSLEQRYWAMKSKAETYQNYKVIKESVMDDVWRIMMDSLKAQKLLVGQRRQAISKLEIDLTAAKDTLAKERAASAQILYDSYHISVLGIDVNKKMFLIFVGASLSVLLIIGAAMLAKIKLVQANANEKVTHAEAIAQEFAEYKKKAMDKQIKLARELQNEKNKLEELRQTPH